MPTNGARPRRLARLERVVGIGVETLALFIRFWLTTTPSLPEPAAQAARAKAGARYNNFVAALGRRLNQGPKPKKSSELELRLLRYRISEVLRDFLPQRCG
jgi:hypothetical protein